MVYRNGRDIYKCISKKPVGKKNVEAEARALSDLTSFYYTKFDTDSVYIIGEQAIRFVRQHQLYRALFFLQQQLFRRYLHDEQILTALRCAEEV